MSKLYEQIQPGRKIIDISDFAEDTVSGCTDLCFFELDNLARRMTDGHGKHYLFIYEDYETDDDGECEPDDWDAPSYITFEGVGDDFDSDDDNPNSDCPYYPV
ncbi:MAG: hypothetical protein RR336_01090 [Oscillospiraceae bacterium]